MAGHRRARGDWWRPPLEAWGGLVGCNSGGRRLRAFGSLAGNRALLRVLAAYVMFILAENAVWIAMLVFAYSRGGAPPAGGGRRGALGRARGGGPGGGVPRRWRGGRVAGRRAGGGGAGAGGAGCSAGGGGGRGGP